MAASNSSARSRACHIERRRTISCHPEQREGSLFMVGVPYAFPSFGKAWGFCRSLYPTPSSLIHFLALSGRSPRSNSLASR